MIREQLNKRFEEIYAQLNNQQKEAVDKIDGPVLVVAGPGTGKTQILSARIGKILLDTDYLPDNILCMTYTDAGRIAMRKRLQEMIGADAYRVNIHTFHSFCNQVIQENVSYFNKNSLDAVSEIETHQYLKKIIDDLPNENPLKRMRGDAYYEMGRMKKLFEVMKKESWKSEFIIEQANVYLNDLPNRDGFVYQKKHKNNKKGDLRQALIDKELKRMNALKAAALTFDTYQKMMYDNNRYDFDDMINWVIKAFEDDVNILADNQEKYQYILVDEFQDTNGSQSKLIELLVKDVEKPNLFVVGDDDQSIFRFQGANVANMQRYSDTYEDMLKKVVLVKNYRSTQVILDSARYVIENNQERLSNTDKSIVKQLEAGNEKRLASSIEPSIDVYENELQEYMGVTQSIYNLISRQGVKSQNIAVIYTTNAQGREFMKYFQAKQIPYFSKTSESLFEIPLSKKLIQILRYVARERKVPYSADDLLFEILHYDLYQIPPYEIAKASVRANEMLYKNGASLRTYLQDWIHTKNPTLFETKPHPNMTTISSLLEKWIKESFNIGVVALLETILLESNLLQHAMQSDDKIWHLDVLRCVMDFAKEETLRNPHHDLTSFTTLLDEMEEQEIKFNLQRSYGNELGVNLLTAHSAKGLEFQYVFIVNAIAAAWERKDAKSDGYTIPDTILMSNQSSKESLIEEKRRLFFVAMTRAEEYLHISWSKTDSKLKVSEPSMFIAEIIEKTNWHQQKITLSENDVIDYLQIHLLKDKQPVLPDLEFDFVNKIVDRFEMNVTALNNYLNCPLRFYYNNILRIPSGRSEASTFGSAVHHALERYFKKMRDNENEFLPKEDLSNDFVWYMQRNRAAFTPEALKRRLEYGQQILSDFYDHNIDTWSKIVSVEHMFTNIVVDGVPLKGKLDKLEFDFRDVTIVDYKTGNPSKSTDKLAPPTAKKPLGGDYWRQAVFYKLLVDNNKQKDWHAIQTTFQFVEPSDNDTYENVIIMPSEDDLQTVRNQIQDTWQKIQQHDFYKGCGDGNCTYCNFTKDNKLYVQLVEGVDEKNE